MKELIQAADTALRTCLGLSPEEKLLIVCDNEKENIGKAFFEAGIAITDKTLLVQIPVADVNGQEPPKEVADLMRLHNVVVCPTYRSITHTDAKRNACKAGVRVATMPNISENTMIRTLKADYQQIAKRTTRLAALLDEAKMVHLTSPLGTDLHMPIEGIKAIASTGLLLQKGQGAIYPVARPF